MAIENTLQADVKGCVLDRTTSSGLVIKASLKKRHGIHRFFRSIGRFKQTVEVRRGNVLRRHYGFV